jgi:hypothetical protein
MLRVALLVGTIAALAAVSGAVTLRGGIGGVEAVSPGPQIEFGAVSESGGNIHIPVITTGTGFDPYVGFNARLRWDPDVFAFSSFSSAGTVINSAFCVPPFAGEDPDGGGIIVACAALGAPTTTTGLLGTVVLEPVGAGCSPVRLFTFGPPDGGNGTTGTYTLDEDSEAQDNAYGPNLALDELGDPCVVPGTPTNTPTPTETLPPTDTPTPTNTPTPTATPILGAPDVTVAIFSVPTSGSSGAGVSYSMIATNHGDAAAVSVEVRLTLPQGSVPFLGPPCRGYDAGDLICKVPNLAANDGAPGGPDQAAIIANVRLPIVTASMNATVVAEISAANEPVENTGNNTSQTQTLVVGCPDLNGDDAVNIQDLSIAGFSFGLQLGDPGYNPLADQNGDDVITIADLAIMGQRFGEACRGLDSDGDGLTDREETELYGTDPFNPDTDGDGLPDGVEILMYGSNPFVEDTSGDFYTDAEKAAIAKDPTHYCLIMAGDVIKDGFVNIQDISAAGMAFGTMTGDPAFFDRADINRDGAVNIQDLSLIGMSFGKSIMECPWV